MQIEDQHGHRARSRAPRADHAPNEFHTDPTTSLMDMDRPAWQTDDLDEEWVDDDSLGTQSLSLTTPLPSRVQTPPPGTYLIRNDVPATAFLPKTPARHIKDFFSPLALERMFEPPEPPPQKPLALALAAAPAIPSRLSQAFTPHDTRSDSDTSPRATLQRPFTFSVPRQAESTPGHVYSAAQPPMTDPRLRLFQLQYDTFTRDHLSAMVDSIAVNTPSRESAGDNSPVQPVLFHPQHTPASDDTPVRSIKRIKLSPPSDFYGEGAGAGAVVSRPRASRVDYVGESRSLMQQIKQARDFSTMSTNIASRTPTTSTSQVQALHLTGASVPPTHLTPHADGAH